MEDFKMKQTSLQDEKWPNYQDMAGQYLMPHNYHLALHFWCPSLWWLRLWFLCPDTMICKYGKDGAKNCCKGITLKWHICVFVLCKRFFLCPNKWICIQNDYFYLCICFLFVAQIEGPFSMYFWDVWEYTDTKRFLYFTQKFATLSTRGAAPQCKLVKYDGSVPAFHRPPPLPPPSPSLLPSSLSLSPSPFQLLLPLLLPLLVNCLLLSVPPPLLSPMLSLSPPLLPPVFLSPTLTASTSASIIPDFAAVQAAPAKDGGGGHHGQVCRWLLVKVGPHRSNLDNIILNR